MPASFPEIQDQSLRVLFELNRHPIPTFVAQLPEGNLVVVERHTLTPSKRVAVLRLAHALETICHPNVSRTRKVIDTIGVASLVSEYVEGEMLASIEANAETSGSTIPLAIKLRAIVDVLNGVSILSAFHELFLEADAYIPISPASILVGTDGTTRLVHPHAAIASCPKPDSDGYRFLAPELANGDRPTKQSGVFSVGVLLAEAMALAEGETLVPLLAPIMKKALADDPSDRYATAMDFAIDIRRIIQGKLASPHQVASFVRQRFENSLSDRNARYSAATPDPIQASRPAANKWRAFDEEEAETRPALSPLWASEATTRPDAQAIAPSAGPLNEKRRLLLVQETERESASASIPTPAQSLSPMAIGRISDAPDGPTAESRRERTLPPSPLALAGGWGSPIRRWRPAMMMLGIIAGLSGGFVAAKRSSTPHTRAAAGYGKPTCPSAMLLIEPEKAGVAIPAYCIDREAQTATDRDATCRARESHVATASELMAAFRSRSAEFTPGDRTKAKTIGFRCARATE